MNGFGSPLAPFLDPGEKLLWSGQPKQGMRLQASDAVMIPFSLMWGGFAIFWEAAALGLVASNGHPHPKPPVFMALWGIPFVAIGLYMIVGRFFYDTALRRKTWYGVTDRRVIILKSLFNTNLTSFDYGNLANLNLVERGDHRGDILFGLPQAMATFGSRSSRNTAIPGFYQLTDVRKIFNQIRAIQLQATK
jgi:hypothetical protein